MPAHIPEQIGVLPRCKRETLTHIPLRIHQRLILVYHTRTEPVAVRIFQHNAILWRIRLKIGGSVHKRHALRHFHLLMPDDGSGDLTVGAADSVCEQKRRQTVCQFFIQYTLGQHLIVDHRQMIVDVPRLDLCHCKLLHRALIFLVYLRLFRSGCYDIDKQDRLLRIGKRTVILEIHLNHARNSAHLTRIQRHQIRLIEPCKSYLLLDSELIPPVVLGFVTLCADQICTDGRKHLLLRLHLIRRL